MSNRSNLRYSPVRQSHFVRTGFGTSDWKTLVIGL